jgi:hypothetical protein
MNEVLNDFHSVRKICNLNPDIRIKIRVIVTEFTHLKINYNSFTLSTGV